MDSDEDVEIQVDPWFEIPSSCAQAAIQGLNQKVDELSDELKRRDAENAELKRSGEDLRRMILKAAKKQE